MVENNALDRKRWIGQRKGIGCCIPKEKKAYDQVVLAFTRDLVAARELSGKGKSNAVFFAKKALMIEESLESFAKKWKDRKAEKHEVGYDLGHKYIYPGLPVEFAESIDPPILEIIELIAECRHVAMTGSCCAGHPSKRINNLLFDSSMNDSEESIYSQNVSPYLRLVLNRDGVGERIAERLVALKTKGPSVGNAEIVILRDIQQVNDDIYRGKLALQITGVPGLFSKNGSHAHEEVVAAYQKALSAFWNVVKHGFEKAMDRKVKDTDPADFLPKASIDWRQENELIQKRKNNGREPPNYMYFNGTEELVLPVMIE